MMGILINLILFIFFFSHGYYADDEHAFSGSIFLIISGLIFWGLMAQTTFTNLLHAVYTLPLFGGLGLLFILLGVKKMNDMRAKKE